VNLILRHFWLLFLVVMLINVAIWRTRLAALVSAGRASEDEVDGFIRGLVIAVVGFALASEAIVLAAGWPNPLCIYSEPLTSPGVVASFGVTLVLWAALMWWVWRGQGADLLARLGPALMRPPMRPAAYTPRQVRLAVSIVMAFAVIALVIGLQMQPPMPSCRELTF
jgi:hypothetical protein